MNPVAEWIDFWTARPFQIATHFAWAGVYATLAGMAWMGGMER